MPEVRHSRALLAPPRELWQIVCDPHHLPRWWPRVHRVEAVDEDAFTEVLLSDRGRFVRADFTVLERDQDQMKVVWAQQVDGTPFARVLASSRTEISLSEAANGQGTQVTISLDQALRKWRSGARERPRGGRSRGGLDPLFAILGSRLVRRAASATVKEALDGLERIAG